MSDYWPDCEHEWEEAEDGSGTDLHGVCLKCGITFARYIHVYSD